ncbi:hypothetical protein [Mucilaginibacter psychrotolerans]|uniref:Uncharacterized protein n=1 Tax=Mucilaginibacter psychrotolerans TaxID=1524096 RepID=A0A4Y8S849_9SPHI|nr:hypothetical protein [Mucilaginibacter psychrotolerans]TFF35179.1 hypothetical protein E2R66_19640 [Mucilaginibacter psychrotolerans]
MQKLFTIIILTTIVVAAKAQSSSTTISGIRYSIGIDAGIRYEKTTQYSPSPNGSSMQFCALLVNYGF